MRILGLDTSTPTASAAIVENGNLVSAKFYRQNALGGSNGSAQSPGNHAEIVLPLIQSALQDAKIVLADLSGIALSIGPGSFTGLRIALATVKGIAYESGLPVVGVSTLHAYAARVMDTEGLICALLDARKQEVYAALFRRANGSLRRLTDDTVLSVKDVFEFIHAAGTTGAVTIVGDGTSVCKTDRLGLEGRISIGAECGALAAQIAELSWNRFCTATTDPLSALEPVYLRLPDAQRKLSLTC